MAQEYIIYCDESKKRGKLFSNFYGGLLIRSEHLEDVRDKLQRLKNEQNLFKELKWVRVSEQYEAKYKAVLDKFFDLVAEDKIKVRVMFTQNIHVPILTETQIEQSYFLLYYQFIKHAFGLRFSNPGRELVDVRVYVDHIPHTREKTEQFKGFVANLTLFAPFRVARIRILRENIAEINSADHVLAQCVDLVLGAMQFRMNNMHKEKEKGARLRGKRTRAKERIYKHIRSRLIQLRPNFNIGITTGHDGDSANRWTQSYRHWRFVPANHRMEPKHGEDD